MTLPAPARRPNRWWLAMCLVAFTALGLAVRGGLAIVWPSVHRPDELFQNLEPAHRLLTGWGIVPWEWRDGIRSWLFPDLLYGIMRATSLLHLPPEMAVPIISVILSAAATATVVLGVWLGWRRSGLLGAVLCGLLCALWPDLVYFGPKPLLEVQAGNLLIIAAVLAGEGSVRPPLRPWRMVIIGLLLGLVFDLRFQLAVAVLAVAIAAARLDVRRWLWLVLGALGPVALLGVIDAVTWGYPFQSIWKNVAVNFVANKAEFYGVQPMGWYFLDMARRDGAALLPMVWMFWLGARRAPLLAIETVLIVGFHSLISHKEISFIYAALPPAMIVIGLGSARLIESLDTVLRTPPRRSAMLFSAAAVCCGLMLLVALATAPFKETETPLALRTLWASLRARSDLCGIGLYGSYFPWWQSPGYTGLNRSVPMYLLHRPEEVEPAKTGFNYAVVAIEDAPKLTGFTTVECTMNKCLLRRPDGCAPVPNYEINTVLVRDGM